MVMERSGDRLWGRGLACERAAKSSTARTRWVTLRRPKLRNRARRRSDRCRSSQDDHMPLDRLVGFLAQHVAVEREHLEAVMRGDRAEVGRRVAVAARW